MQVAESSAIREPTTRARATLMAVEKVQMPSYIRASQNTSHFKL